LKPRLSPRANQRTGKEKKRSDKRQTLFEAQDQIDERKETLLTDIEKRLNQKMEQIERFTLRWKIV
jgi:hypothetical protein